MNRGRRGYSNSRGGRGKPQQTWRAVTPNPSPSLSPPTVQADLSSTGHISNTSDRISRGSWQAQTLDSRRNGSQNVTPVAGGQSWSAYGRGSDSCGASERQLSTSFKGHDAPDSSNVNQLGTASSECDVVLKDVGKSYVSESLSVNIDRMRIIDPVSSESRLSRKLVDGKNDSETKVADNTNNLCDNGSSGCVFDICPSPKSSSVVTLKAPLFAKNREKRKEMERSTGLKGKILRSGMVLLKSYLSLEEQMRILSICRAHGRGPAGFYQPAFREGGQLHLRLMCFGEFWDCETKTYGKVRPFDHAKPPPIPLEFLQLVDRAIKDSHSLLREGSRVKNVDDILPPVKPDICLVNYYSKTGRLGLHQDKDESRESIDKGTPIVSFSIGDSAGFLYSDQCDVQKANQVILESGDVLIFGGSSRKIFHGVSEIKPDTAPKSLLEETNFRPGRLNLTFRQHF